MKRIKNTRVFVLLLYAAIAVMACNNQPQGYTMTDTPTKGTIYISVDESFKPVISQQIKVYESTYPQTHIIATYESEADCFRDLQKDSTRMIIVARGLTEEESSFYKAKLSYKPDFDVLAYDAVDVIVNAASKDTVFTLKQLQNMLNGTDTAKDVVLDGKNATSTVRYLLDSVVKGKAFGSNVKAAPNSQGVVDFVARNAHAIGFVGSSWVGNDQDPDQLKYADKLTLAILECKNKPGYFARPAQASIMYGQYPLVRPVYYILKENFVGLGRAFKTFMMQERGQLIFRRSLLAPAVMNFNVRSGNLEKN
ncbi:MAG TPA: substrate-binding domain-containing protein [Chitinophagaceae bacterium]|nr:substrate-binding domain-containing protein [Chitinophagaceae bacterium]